MKKQYSFSQTKASNLCTIPHRLEAFSYQVVIFLGGGVLHSQPQPTFQRLQIAEQNVVDLITYQRRMDELIARIEQVIKNNMSMIFPMCISLIAGYMISREQTDDTLKNILTVPISFKRLLTGKLIVCGVLSIIFGLICSLFTIIAELLVGFPGFRVTLALKSILQITAVNFFLYLAVLPIIVITCRKAGSFLVGVIIAFVYGYGGMFAAGNMTLANIYPITASLGMVGYRNYDTAVHWNIIACMCSLAFVVIISAVFILCTKETEPQKAKKKAKKVIAKKGW